MSFLSWLGSLFNPQTPTPAPPAQSNALARAILAQVQAGNIVTFSPTPVLTSMVSVSVGGNVEATCPTPALLLPAMTAAAAQPATEEGAITNFTVFPSQTYAPGQYISPTVTYDGSGVQLAFQCPCPTWASDDPSIVLEIECEQSFDNGATWVYSDAQPHNGEVYDATFSPATLKSGSVGPGGAFTCNDGLGARLVRAVMTITGGSLTLGVTASTSA